MIIWQGLGFLGALIPVVCYVLMALSVQAIAGPAYLDQHSWPGAMGTLFGAGLVWFLAARLERPTRTLIDQRTGETLLLKKRHTLFFVPLRYLTGVLAVVAVGMLILKSSSSL